MYPQEYRAWVERVGESRPVGGESYAELQVRGIEELKRIALESVGKTVVVGSHGGMIRAVRAYLKGVELKNIKEVKHVPNASITEIDYDEETGKVTFIKEGYDDYLLGLSTNVTITE